MEKGGLGLSTDGRHPETQFRRMALQGPGAASGPWGRHSINSLQTLLHKHQVSGLLSWPISLLSARHLDKELFSGLSSARLHSPAASVWVMNAPLTCLVKPLQSL